MFKLESWEKFYHCVSFKRNVLNMITHGVWPVKLETFNGFYSFCLISIDVRTIPWLKSLKFSYKSKNRNNRRINYTLASTKFFLCFQTIHFHWTNGRICKWQYHRKGKVIFFNKEHLRSSFNAWIMISSVMCLLDTCLQSRQWMRCQKFWPFHFLKLSNSSDQLLKILKRVNIR